MAKADILVGFRDGEERDGLVRYEPGGQMRGTVQITPDDEVRCKHLWVSLGWHTEGRGNPDRKKVAEADVFHGTLSPGIPSSYDFQFTLPREPWSYLSHYISIVWDITVNVDVPWAINPHHTQQFVLAPRGEFATY